MDSQFQRQLNIPPITLEQRQIIMCKINRQKKKIENLPNDDPRLQKKQMKLEYLNILLQCLDKNDFTSLEKFKQFNPGFGFGRGRGRGRRWRDRNDDREQEREERGRGRCRGGKGGRGGKGRQEKNEEQMEKQVQVKHNVGEDSSQLSQTQNEDNLCIICMFKKRQYVAIPCGHYKYCEECSIEILQKKECALCRKKISEMVKIY